MSGTGRYTVRRFDPARDIEAACRCYVSSFHHNSWPVIDHSEPSLVDDLLLATARSSDATFVAELDGEVRGLLSGYFPARAGSLLRSVLVMGRLEARVLLHRYEMTAFARAAWWRMSKGFFEFFFRAPRHPAEVTLLMSEEGYRGGIGRALMDAWVGEVGRAGYDRTDVNTDSTVSWDFYERYGFKRIRDFPLKMFFYSLPGEDARGYIYTLDIKG